MNDQPKVPAQIEPYVRVLGVDGAVEFLLSFGGAELYIPRNAKGKSMVAKKFGIEKAQALAEASELLPRRVPTAKPWIARQLYKKNLSVAEIARRLHVTDVTIRSYLKRAPQGEIGDPRQLRLF